MNSDAMALALADSICLCQIKYQERSEFLVLQWLCNHQYGMVFSIVFCAPTIVLHAFVWCNATFLDDHL